MGIDILIDKLTPCLVEASTGAVQQTYFSIASERDLAGTAGKGWLFDWESDALRKRIYTSW